MTTYHSKDFLPDVAPLVHLFNLHGNNLIGMEVGVFQAFSFCTLLQLPNIKELHGVDHWQSLNDYLGSTDGSPTYILTQEKANMSKAYAETAIQHNENSDKAILHHMNSNDCAMLFPDEHFDFIFLDAYLTHEQAINDLEVWYPKIKKGGLFTGHDYNSPEIYNAVDNFRSKNIITNPISGYANCFAWNKEG